MALQAARSTACSSSDLRPLMVRVTQIKQAEFRSRLTNSKTGDYLHDEPCHACEGKDLSFLVWLLSVRYSWSSQSFIRRAYRIFWLQAMALMVVLLPIDPSLWYIRPNGGGSEERRDRKHAGLTHSVSNCSINCTIDCSIDCSNEHPAYDGGATRRGDDRAGAERGAVCVWLRSRSLAADGGCDENFGFSLLHSVPFKWCS